MAVPITPNVPYWQLWASSDGETHIVKYAPHSTNVRFTLHNILNREWYCCCGACRCRMGKLQSKAYAKSVQAVREQGLPKPVKVVFTGERTVP